MATLQTKTFTQVVQDQVTAAQGGTSRFLVDFSIGSILRAVIEASAAVVMWLQGLILQLLSTTRASTSAGSDLDSWMADYGLTRNPAVFASGAVTFARFTPTNQATINVGAIVQTADGTEQFKVVADTTQPAWNATAGAYIIPAGTASITATVNALTAGAAGNVTIGSLNTLGQAISGVDTVTNAAALAGGADAESDPAFRTRFVAWVASLARATKAAVGYAISTVQTGLTYTITENQNYAGVATPGYFYVVVDDGTGTPPSTLITAVALAVDAVRPVNSTFGVFAPVVVTANMTMTITTAVGYDHAGTVAAVTAALQSYTNTLPIGGTLAWSRLSQIAYGVSSGVTNVSAVTLNGGTSDLTSTNQQVIKAGTVVVS